MTGGESDSNLCYEVHGERSRSLNLVSDVCFSINARYEEIEGTSNNKIDEVAIRTSDASNNCIDILIDSGDDCAIALLRTGTEFESLTRRYRRNGIQIDFVSGSIEILLPCARYPGGGIRVVVKCLSEFEDLFTESILPVKNLQVVFNRAKLPESTTPMPHGLLGKDVEVYRQAGFNLLYRGRGGGFSPKHYNLPPPNFLMCVCYSVLTLVQNVTNPLTLTQT